MQEEIKAKFLRLYNSTVLPKSQTFIIMVQIYIIEAYI